MFNKIPLEGRVTPMELEFKSLRHFIVLSSKENGKTSTKQMQAGWFASYKHRTN